MDAATPRPVHNARRRDLTPTPAATESEWLDVTRVARVEASSQDPRHPVEDAFTSTGDGWRAADPGEQVIRIHFHTPRTVARILVVFNEAAVDRMQEFTLSWSSRRGETHRQIARQQFAFRRFGASRALQVYDVELHDATGLELRIVPDMHGGDAFASLAEVRIA